MRILPAALAASCLVASFASPAAEPLRLVAMESRLFFHHTGLFSRPLDGSQALHNVVIGEGGFDEPSTATMVTVVLQGKAGDYDEKWRVDFTAKARKGGKTLATASKDLGVLSPKGEYRVAFWLPDTGCEALELTAKLRGTNQQKSATIPFRCGE